MLEDRQAGGLLVEARGLASWGGRPSVFHAALGDQWEEGIGEEEGGWEMSPACGQLGCHCVWVC